MKISDKKKHDVLDFWNTLSVMFFLLSKITALRVFLVFLTKDRPILTALKQMILDEYNQSNGVKPQKNQFFHDFL